MNRNSKLMEVASRLWPGGHEQFEEMCTLAATGHLGGPQMSELNQHLATCDSCRKFLESVSQVSVQAVSLLAASRTPAEDAVPPEGMRARFLKRLAVEELKVDRKAESSQQPVIISSALSIPSDARSEKNTPEAPSRTQFRWFSAAWRPAAALAACAAIGFAGFYIGEQRVKQILQQTTQTSPPSAPIVQSSAAADDTIRASQLEQQKALLASELTQLQEKLSSAKSEQKSLTGELAAVKEKLASVSVAPNLPQSTTAESQTARNRDVALQNELDQLNLRLADSESKLTAHKRTAEELTAKLESTETDLQRERELKSATNQFGEVLGARNLHIVDVYDADNNGKQQSALGRVFYIEGKSLVFYAYDLDAPGQFKKNVDFHVWGGKAGVEQVIHSLGILHKDDAGQSRWAMTFDDPKVLAQINSVFVTAEASNKHYAKPHGKKVLYAYFGGQPNHP